MKFVSTLIAGLLTSSVVSAETAFYPQDACAEIISAEYSTGGGDSALQMLEILCKDDDDTYTTFVTNWTSAAGIFGLGRVFLC